MTTATAGLATQEILMGYNPELGMYLPEEPIGSMNATDPLAYTPHEQAVIESWNKKDDSDQTANMQAGNLISEEQAADLEAHYAMEADGSGLITPTEKNKTATENESTGGLLTSLTNGVSDFVTKHPRLAKTAIALGAVGTVGLVAAKDAKGFIWEQLGGDPFVDGGIYSKEKLERVVKSPRGKEALRDEGLNGKEIRAVIDAVDNSDGDRDVRNCALKPGDRFESMVFGESGVIASNVIYTGERSAAYCVDVKMPNGKVIDVKIPKKCGNISLSAHIEQQQEHHKRPTGNLVLTKAFEDVNGNPLSISGQMFRASCKIPGQGKATNTFEYNPAHRRGPVTALKGCKVGSVATMMELTSPEDLAHWEVLTGKPVVKDGQIVGFVQKQQVDRGRNLFGFKNRQLPRPGQPPQLQPQPAPIVIANHAPSGTMLLHQRFVNTRDKVCVDNLNDSDGDQVNVTDFLFTNFNDQPVGQEVGGIYSIDSDTICQDYITPATPQEVEVYAQLTDGKPNGNTTLFNTMPVVPDQK